MAIMRAEYDAKAPEREAEDSAWTKRMERRSRKIED